MNVLIVDHSYAGRSKLLSVFPDAPGTQVMQARTGMEALELLPNCDFNLIVLSIPLPDINWLDVLRFMKNHPIHHQVPVLLISEEKNEDIGKQAAAAGADEYLFKPLKDDLLRQVVTSLVDKPTTL